MEADRHSADAEAVAGDVLARPPPAKQASMVRSTPGVASPAVRPAVKPWAVMLLAKPLFSHADVSAACTLRVQSCAGAGALDMPSPALPQRRAEEPHQLTNPAALLPTGSTAC